MMAEEEATELAVTAASASVPPLDNVASESERIMMTRGVASGVPVALESADETAPVVMTMAEMAGTTAPVEVMMTEKATEMAATASSARSGCIKKLPLINSSKPDFLNLPTTDKEVHSIDATDGLWVKCSICDSSMNKKANPPRASNIVLTRKPFTLGRWLEHKQTKGHTSLLGAQKQSSLREKLADGSITRFEQGELNNLKKKQRCLMFLPKVPHEPLLTACASSARNNSNSTTMVAAAAPGVIVDPSAPSVATAPAPMDMMKSCEGIITGYKERGDTMQQDKIAKYTEYCSIDSKIYMGGKVIWNNLSNVFSRMCKPFSATFQKGTKMFQCNACHGIQ